MTRETKGWDDLQELSPYSPEPVTQQGNNLLVVDGNNLGYRFLHRNNYRNYKDEYFRTVESLAKSYNCKNILLTFDYGKSYYRNSVYPEYKATRKKPQTDEEVERFEHFFACLNEIADLDYFPTAKFRGIEADDIMAYTVLKNRSQLDHIWIVSSDRDIYQLLDDNVSIFNLYSRKEITPSYIQEQFDVTPSEYMLARIISGDDGDNIVGVEGIGEKRSCALAKKYKILPNLLKALPISGKSKYIQNLNKSVDLLITNERLINLLKYNEEAILLGGYQENIMEKLNAVCAFS